MRIKSVCLVAGLVAAAGGVFGTAADAALITSGTVFGNGNGTATVSIIGNSIVITGKNFTGLGPIDISFTTANSGSTNTYTLGEGITNSVNPPITWTDYHEQLGSGIGNTFSLTNTPVNFAPPDSNSNFTVMLLLPYTIDMSQGSVTSGNTVSVGLDLTVPDQPLTTGGTFTLRQFPTVPEPASLGLLVGLGSLLLARRRRA